MNLNKEFTDTPSESLSMIDKGMLLNLILKGNPLASPPVNPLKYGDILTPTILNNELKMDIKLKFLIFG